MEIPGWPGYRVSRRGVVESSRTNGGLIGKTWKVRKPSVDSDGYLRVRLHHRNRSVFVGVHQLVLTCFGSRRPPGDSMALHGNGNRKDNRIENLRWGFALDNTDDRESDGKTARAERNGNAKLDWEEVDAIRQERSTKSTSFQNLADKFGVSKKTVMNIVHNKTWVKEKYKDG